MQTLDSEKVLNIYNFPDYIPDGLVAAFEKEFAELVGAPYACAV